jgi:hypothetical protein
MGTLKPTYLPRRNGIHGLRTRLKTPLVECEEKGIIVHIDEIVETQTVLM